jgi:aspartyl-tRNA(Asn)/glutamyl-tRNA(Gln) amidotransferase subunit A
VRVLVDGQDCEIHTARPAARQKETSGPTSRRPRGPVSVALARSVWYHEQVSDLTPDRVRALADALGLHLSPDDLDEVTHRLNAFHEALALLADLPLASVEPVPAWIPHAGTSARRAGRANRARSAKGRAIRDTRDPDASIVHRSATDLAALIRTRELSPVALVEAYLERIERLDGDLRAYITVCGESALEDAKRVEVAAASGEITGPLHGLPFAVKDQFDTAGVRTTSGSRLLADNVAATDAPVVARLRAAGGILLGKLNMTEFALGGTLDFPFGQPRNPWNRLHDPGGSSSGSGIAAAASLAALTLGEDTGGSVRSPAGWCGAVGLRPTWGLVPRAGCFPLSWSMDAAGPLTRTVEDAALVLGVIAGPDPGDPLMRQASPPDVIRSLRSGVRGLKVGVIRELTLGGDTDQEVRGAVLAAADVLKGLGATVDEVSLPLLPLAGAVFMAIADSEGAGRHRQWLAARGGDYDPGTRRRLVTAALIPTAVYHEMTRARALIRAQVLEKLGHWDVLLAPTAPRTAPLIAQGQAPVTSKDVAAARFFTRRSYTTPFSLAGTPAISVPCGFSTARLPIGLQIAGRPYDEPTVLRVAWAYEQATPWHHERPPIA